MYHRPFQPHLKFSEKFILSPSSPVVDIDKVCITNGETYLRERAVFSTFELFFLKLNHSNLLLAIFLY